MIITKEETASSNIKVVAPTNKGFDTKSVSINITVPSKAFKAWMKNIAEKEYMKLSALIRKLFEEKYGKFKENNEGYINGDT